MAKQAGSLIGSWAFLIGVILAVILGALGPVNKVVGAILIILGIIVGLLNITEKEVMPFLLGSLALVIASSLGAQALSIFDVTKNILNAINVMFVPATVIVALKHVFSLARG